MSKIVHPAYFQIVKREGTAWYFRYGKVFYRGKNTTMEIEHREQEYGLTKEKIAIELFRINAGRAGYYLVDLKDRKYYYCGLELEDVKNVLQSLGIGRPDPVAGN